MTPTQVAPARTKYLSENIQIAYLACLQIVKTKTAKLPACVQSYVTETLNDECLASPTGCRTYVNIDDVSAINTFETLNMHTNSTHVIGFVDKVFQSVENSSACCRDSTMYTALIDWFS